MPVQRLITRLTTLRSTVPNYVNQATYPIYLGMPPLPLTINLPLAGRSEHVANISGISRGSVAVSTESEGPESSGWSDKRINYGSDGSSNGKKGRNSTKRTRIRGKRRGSRVRGNKKNSSAKNIPSSSTGVRVLNGRGGRKLYMKNGRFIKKP